MSSLTPPPPPPHPLPLPLRAVHLGPSGVLTRVPLIYPSPLSPLPNAPGRPFGPSGVDILHPFPHLTYTPLLETALLRAVHLGALKRSPPQIYPLAPFLPFDSRAVRSENTGTFPLLLSKHPPRLLPLWAVHLGPSGVETLATHSPSLNLFPQLPSTVLGRPFRAVWNTYVVLAPPLN